MESSDLMTVTEADALTITDRETNEIVRNALKRTATVEREQRREDVVADTTARDQQWMGEYPTMVQERMDVETKMAEADGEDVSAADLVGQASELKSVGSSGYLHEDALTQYFSLERLASPKGPKAIEINGYKCPSWTTPTRTGRKSY